MAPPRLSNRVATRDNDAMSGSGEDQRRVCQRILLRLDAAQRREVLVVRQRQVHVAAVTPVAASGTAATAATAPAAAASAAVAAVAAVPTLAVPRLLGRVHAEDLVDVDLAVARLVAAVVLLLVAPHLRETKVLLLLGELLQTLQVRVHSAGIHGHEALQLLLLLLLAGEEFFVVNFLDVLRLSLSSVTLGLLRRLVPLGLLHRLLGRLVRIGLLPGSAPVVGTAAILLGLTTLLGVLARRVGKLIVRALHPALLVRRSKVTTLVGLVSLAPITVLAPGGTDISTTVSASRGTGSATFAASASASASLPPISSRG
mmetsp:Transcript_13639/g.38747  ORF Transcript_13639/g.38747 Transcript_13639/m.38747 type:complete len:315 (-) Transcript_13639:285-1229(-)